MHKTETVSLLLKMRKMFPFDDVIMIITTLGFQWLNTSKERSWNRLGPISKQRPCFQGMGIPMLKIRRSWDRLIFNMRIPILVRRYLNIQTHTPIYCHWGRVELSIWQSSVHPISVRKSLWQPACVSDIDLLQMKICNIHDSVKTVISPVC